MPEAVIVDAIRTRIGRAINGSPEDMRAEDLAAMPRGAAHLAVGDRVRARRR